MFFFFFGPFQISSSDHYDAVGMLLLLHHVDMLVNAFNKDDVMGLANLITLLFWAWSERLLAPPPLAVET